MFGHAEPLPFAVDPLIAEAKQRARRRRLLALAAAGLVAAAVAGVEFASAGAGGSPGAVPWLPARPNLWPASVPLAPPCSASQLRASLSLQGATMSLVGPIELVNRSSQPCSLLGRPKISFANATSKWRETVGNPNAAMPYDPLAPPLRSLRALRPGEHVSVQLWWSNWCGHGAKPGGSLTQSPAAIVLTPPGGGQLRLTHSDRGHGLPSPVCNGGAGTVSQLQVARFTPYVPQGPPSSALPLRARIVASSPPAAHAGGWFDYTVVLTNTSRRTFTFGPRCPAYLEGMGDTENEAYLLNCRGVGPIAPKQSVRFAMRVRVPEHPNGSSAGIGWTLAPHSWSAPQAFAVVPIH